ncbi:ribonuclease T2 family protein [Sphingomonas sp. RIT328]|uniref:ribonuclease T2 family protein n=1 Tax=Sphingomonas sp. RIT328 TaxID=1470591 RepID=UPI00044DF6EB|nr:ribonuclease T [Sphingomonas sp. RIT328]EZP52649.1 Ribonuclease T2 family protein [Sphingomonas sp. RIT328]
MIVRLAAAALVALLPVAAQAQADRCIAPGALPRPRPDLPSDSQPRRLLPIGGYTLAITWSPQYCRDHGGDGDARFQCRSGQRFGFTLHGLWPDGVGKDWPQYCQATPLLSRTTIRRHICATPSAQLMQHEWSKHGTCMAGYDPERYFTTSNRLYGKLRFPDWAALSRGPVTAGAVAAAMAKRNPGLGADMMRVTATKQGWLNEIWICLDTAFRYQRCPVHQGGLPGAATVKIAL